VGRLRNRIQKVTSRFVKKHFAFWEKMGIHITPCHFYEPVPILSELSDEIWKKKSECLGISINEEFQCNVLSEICGKYKNEYDTFGFEKPSENCPYFVKNGSFGGADGDVLYSLIRHFKPKRIIEVGSGWSTLLLSAACERNREEVGKAELIAIEPNPPEFLKHVKNIKLIQKKVQEIGFDIFETLEENDILFLDSSHIVAIGSDVCYEFLEILPRLNRGVLIHIHDIFIPYEYPKRWVKGSKRFWNEAYLVQAFLMYNSAFEVIWAGNWMKTKYPEAFARMFRSSDAQSLWIRRMV
jgi:predicted O-methyltransferase YrrM